MFTKSFFKSTMTTTLLTSTTCYTRAISMRLHSSSSSSGLDRVASFRIETPTTTPFSLVISSGSVLLFSYPHKPTKSAIVNAANQRCLGGGGVDGAISSAGGPALLSDRLKLPIISSTDQQVGDIRCPTGTAKITGPGNYGSLKVPYVIHAVGPDYFQHGSYLEKGDELLRSAYLDSLKRAEEVLLEAVGFSLISSGVYRGERTKREVLRVGVKAICDFSGYDELKEVHLCAFSFEEINLLLNITSELCLEKEN